jgi:hypothetical protein
MFSWKKQARFEVVVDQGGYSSIDGIFDDDRQATERTTYLLSLAKYSRVQELWRKLGDDEVRKAAYRGG